MRDRDQRVTIVLDDLRTTRLHPISCMPFDYDTCCNQCVYFCDRTHSVNKVKTRTTKCAHDPEQRNLANIEGTVWKALPGCTKYQRKEHGIASADRP